MQHWTSHLQHGRYVADECDDEEDSAYDLLNPEWEPPWDVDDDDTDTEYDTESNTDDTDTEDDSRYDAGGNKSKDDFVDVGAEFVRESLLAVGEHSSRLQVKRARNA